MGSTCPIQMAWSVWSAAWSPVLSAWTRMASPSRWMARNGRNLSNSAWAKTTWYIGSVLGALLGYAIGALLFEAVGRPLIAFYGYTEPFAQFTARYNQWGAWIVAFAALTPFPFKVITIASGATGLDLAVFVLSATLARGLRFTLEAALLWRFGPSIRGFIEGHLKFVTTAFFCLLIGGFVMIKYLL